MSEKTCEIKFGALPLCLHITVQKLNQIRELLNYYLQI